MVSLSTATARRACKALRAQLSAPDSLVAGLAAWLGVSGLTSAAPPSEAGLWLARDVALAGLLEASGQPAPRPFTEGLASLRSRTFFAPHTPGVFESDPVAILAVAIGIRTVGDVDAAVWIRELAERASTGEVDPWRVSLLHAAESIAGDAAPRTQLPSELAAVLTAKGVRGCDRPSQRALNAACLAGGEVPPERALFRLAALTTDTRAPRKVTRAPAVPILARPPAAVDVGVITIKEEEFAAALRHLGPTSERRGTRRNYEIAERPTAGGGTVRVAVTRCVQQGNAHAQMAASDLLEDLAPKYVLVVGIGGGRPTVDFTLGDVVLSSFVHDLTLEDTGTQRPARYGALGGPLDPEAARIVAHLPALLSRMGDWTARVQLARPPFDTTSTTNNATWNAQVSESSGYHRDSGRTRPIVRSERIVSSDRLVKDPELLTQWASVLKGIAVVEMESAGVYAVCQHKRVPYLAIRGISDIVGTRRDERWTAYACDTAATFAQAFIDSGAFTDRVKLGRRKRDRPSPR